MNCGAISSNATHDKSNAVPIIEAIQSEQTQFSELDFFNVFFSYGVMTLTDWLVT